MNQMIFAENCYLFAENKSQMMKMIGDAAGNLKARGVDWKEDQMELISWGREEQVGDLEIEEGGKEYMIKEVDSLRTMGALITKEADSMSALKFRMSKADKALWMEMNFQKNYVIAEEGKHTRYREVVRSCLLHSCESWSWNKEMVDALHGRKSRNLDLMSSRRWAQMGKSMEWFRDKKIRKARQRFVQGGW